MPLVLVQGRGHLICANCKGLGVIIIGDEDYVCYDCDGEGGLDDVDFEELSSGEISA